MSTIAGTRTGRVTGSIPPTGTQLGSGHVAGQQRPRRQPAGVLERRERGRQRHAGGQAERGLQGGRDDHRHPDVLGDPQTGAHPTQRLDLEHRDVGGTEVAHAIGIGRSADRLVGGDRDRHASAYGGQVLDRRAWLLDVLQAPGGPVELTDGGDGAIDVPRPVGVDADVPATTERVTDRLDPGQVVGQREAGLGDLDLGGRAPGGEHQRVSLRGREHGHGDVDGYGGP